MPKNQNHRIDDDLRHSIDRLNNLRFIQEDDRLQNFNLDKFKNPIHSMAHLATGMRLENKIRIEKVVICRDMDEWFFAYKF